MLAPRLLQPSTPTLPAPSLGPQAPPKFRSCAHSQLLHVHAARITLDARKGAAGGGLVDAPAVLQGPVLQPTVSTRFLGRRAVHP